MTMTWEQMVEKGKAMSWPEHQEWERSWWGNCCNTYAEEMKQLMYARRMGLHAVTGPGTWPVYDMQGKCVLDLGGGPVSMLLKCWNAPNSVVVDPCAYPPWVAARYASAGIAYVPVPAENFRSAFTFDECWIYNVLQHVRDPAIILANARASAKLIRIFEWIGIPPHPGHPQELNPDVLRSALGGAGTIEQMNENGCNGRAFYGVFKC